MAPKRKAPISKLAGQKPANNPKHTARPPPAKKARVEVEYESTPSSKGKGKAAPSPSNASTKSATAAAAGGKGAVGGKQGGGAGAGGLTKKKSTENFNKQPTSVAAAASRKKDKKKPAQKKKVAFPDDTNNDFSQPVGVSHNADNAQPSLLSRHPASTAPTAAFDSTHLPAPITPLHPKEFQVIAGSYEKLLYGLTANFPPLDRQSPAALEGWEWDFKPVFIFPAHQASVKAVGTSEGGKWLATGSTDEIVKIWDLRKRKEVGGLLQHSGSITSLVFPTRSHLLSASEDATLSLFRTRDWSLLRSFKGHTGRINSVAVHPTGKVALSVGVDRTLRMWDLMKGKAAGSTKIHKEGEVIRFSPSGTHLAVLSQTSLDLFTIDMQLITTFSNPKRFHDFHFLTLPATTSETGQEDGEGKERELLFASTEEGQVRVWEKVAGEGEREDGSKEEDWREIARFGGHTNRVKSFSLLFPMLSTISSDGFINLYLLTSLPPSPAPLAPASETSSLPVILPVTSYDTKGTRLTCMSMCIVTEPGMGSEAGSEFGGVQEVLSEDDDEDEDEEAWGGVGGDSDEESEGEEGSDGFEENPGYANEDEMEEEDEDEGEYE